MDFFAVLQRMVELFLIIVIGYGVRKAGVINTEGRSVLSKLVLNISLPATILSSVMNASKLPETGELLMILLVAVLSYVVIFVFAFATPKILGVKKNQVGIYRFMMAFGNVGFIGFPVVDAIFGADAIFYASVFNLPFNVLCYSVGVAFVKQSAVGQAEASIAGGAASSAEKAGWKKYLGFLLTPCMIASVISVAMAFLQLKGPSWLGSTMSMVGGVTTPVALLIIGMALAEMPVKEMFLNPRIYLFSALRLLALPAVTYLLFRTFVSDPLLLGICTVISAMPVATSGTMLCMQYGSDEKLMAQGTFISTLFAIVTIPLVAMFV